VTKVVIERLFLLDLMRDTQSRAVLIYALGTILVGGYAFHQVEGWSIFDAMYFMIIAMTTIGYGDYTPVTSWGKVLTIFFGLNGIVVLLALYDRIRALRWESKFST
jgi:hypothetical protein